MKINNLLILCTLCSLMSCNSFKEHYSMDFLMDEYYMKHLSYPKNIDEYLRQTYKADSLNNFVSLNFDVQNSHIDIDSVDDPVLTNIIMHIINQQNLTDVDYDQYNDLRKMAHDSFEDVDMLGEWGLLAHTEPNVKFKQSKSYLSIMIPDPKVKCKYRKAGNLLQEYATRYNSWNNRRWKKGDDDITLKKARVHELEKTRVYIIMEDGSLIYKDANCIPGSLENSLNEILDEVAAIDTEKEGLQKKIHFLQYSKQKGFSDYVHNNDIPPAISNNKRLKDCIDSILQNTKTEVIQFSCVMAH